ncbi:type VI secretion system Vgr family protein [Spartinivicinus poritis]|uniref:Type VI secretion system tip protein TssI/VgrG n=1 Tax=Spartinivicinus poritis TaxID=2994640 RepID=A0ABT5UB03_9GAMM|nr:type VI secretion system tip protein TssI/VgrG [Spartinivicinus sp. A2-2]MDE1462717.1 type VI secretion system tip protein TssI/VgrG [Spartinivicinus sp. A2-2]
MPVAANRSQFTITVSGCEDELRVVSFTGTENLSDTYSFNVFVVCENPALNFKQLYQQAALLTLLDEQQSRLIHGEVSQFKQLTVGRRFSRYQLQIVPKLWFLKFRATSQIFQQLTTPEIIKQVLEDANISGENYEFRLANSYQPRIYCVQSQETDYDFICRLMAEDGIHFHFEHKEERHTLIFGDSKPAFTFIEGKNIIFKAKSSMVAEQDTTFTLSLKRAVGVGKVSLRDYDFTNPRLDLEVSQNAEHYQQLERYHYPGQYLRPDAGNKQGKRQLEADQASQVNIVGKSTSVRLIAGYRVQLQQHPTNRLNQEVIIKQVNHVGEQPQAEEEEATTNRGSQYHNSFTAMPAEQPFRIKSQQTKLHLKGLQTAVVSGPAGEEIYTNEYGQIKIQFQWDRQGQNDENTSKWVRVIHNWTGPQWGQLTLPRLGQELMLDFINGDPDQPIALSRIYHANNKPPYKLPPNKTRLTLKSQSSLGGDGFNEIRYEDKKGQEQIFFHGEKDWNLIVKHVQREQIQANRHLIVDASRYETIKGEHHRKKDQLANREIGQSENITSGQQYQLKTASIHTEKTGTEQQFQASMKMVIEAGNEATVTAGGSFIKVNAAGVFVSPKSTITAGKVGHGSFSLSLPVGVVSGVMAALTNASLTGTPLVEDCRIKEECEDCGL